MDLETRIKQFSTLLESDPDNDMAHFSLANALIQAERHEEAAESFLACTRINPGMTKAFQLAGRALIDSDQTDRAVTRSSSRATRRRPRAATCSRKTRSPTCSARSGRTSPKSATRPQPKAAAAPRAATSRTGRRGAWAREWPAAPFKGPVGAWYLENISKENFDEWIGMGTKIINELRLDLSRDEHDLVYDYAMRRYLGLDDDTYREITGGQEPPVPEGQFKSVIDEIVTRAGNLEDEQGQMHAASERVIRAASVA